jgi:hypothetical protein
VQESGFAYVGKSAYGVTDTGSIDRTDVLATLRFGLPTLTDRMAASRYLSTA